LPVHPDDAPPRFRGVSHQIAFFLAVPLGLVLAFQVHSSIARVATIAFATSVTTMLGASSLLHRVRWDPVRKHRMALFDHAMIYVLIAGTYTPFALLVLSPGWGIPILATVWGCALVLTATKLLWANAPKTFAPATCVGLGWISVIVFPQIVGGIGIGGGALLAAGGLAYTVGAAVYARRRPDPFPHTFGYHEVFHGLVLVGVVCQYATVAFFVLPRAS
jgi:hemolysin III